ncbi:MAG: glucosaminidase domain-containing protein [Paludibacteraceae bacterium]|nr:glucosaminidase domain-containing protein [Paludibacteraceae bacterium]MBR6105254.1 glucosaminidase domain-containing protein [Paludibacteraceae bacterium]
MKINKLFITCVGFFMIAHTAYSKQLQSFLDYIDKYNKIAVEEMKVYGIPASITLAQGLLESGAGLSQLSKESNNHFGIKCHDWKGDRVYFDDDEKGECFRKYTDPKDSYKDHSEFLASRPRYASLFELKSTDYKGWAKGLKQCGYATDPNYANRLISLIEEYGLDKYDKDIKKKKDKKDSPSEGNKDKNNSSDKQGDNANEKKKVEYVLKSSMGTVDASNTHTAFKKNGKHVVIARANDTYEGIAKEFGLKNWEIRWYNKVKKGETPAEGSTVIIKKW